MKISCQRYHRNRQCFAREPVGNFSQKGKTLLMSFEEFISRIIALASHKNKKDVQKIIFIWTIYLQETPCFAFCYAKKENFFFMETKKTFFQAFFLIEVFSEGKGNMYYSGGLCSAFVISRLAFVHRRLTFDKKCPKNRFQVSSHIANGTTF